MNRPSILIFAYWLSLGAGSGAMAERIVQHRQVPYPVAANPLVPHHLVQARANEVNRWVANRRRPIPEGVERVPFER